MVSFMESELSEVEESQDEVSGRASRSGTGNRKKRSKVWMYFKELKNSDGSICGDCVECTECGKTIKTKTGNTTNLMSHLSIKHPRKHADVKQKAEGEKKQNAKRPRELDDSQQATLTMMTKKKAKLETSSSRHKKITKKDSWSIDP